MKKFHHLTLAALSLAAFLPQACGLIEVEEVTDIDTTSTLAKGTEVTVVAEKKITLGDFLNFGEGSGANGIIQVSADGDYSIEYNLEPQSIGNGFTFDASSFTLNLSNHFDYSYKFSDNTVIPARTPISCNSSDKAAFSSLLSTIGVNIDLDFFESLLSQNYSFDFDIDFTVNNFPDMINSFKKADLNGQLSMNLVPTGIPFEKFVFKQGFEIKFPSFFRFSNCDNNLFEIKDGYKLVAKQDVDVVLGTGISFNLDLASLDLGDGVVTNGSLPLQDKVAVAGVISVNPEQDLIGQKETVNLTDKTYIAQQLEENTTMIDPAWKTLPNYEALKEAVAEEFITNTLHLTPGEPGHEVTIVKDEVAIGNLLVVCGYAANNVAIQNATIKLSKSAIPSFDGNYGFDIGNLPEELSADGNTIELSDVQVNLSVNSTLPFDFGLNAKLNAIGGNHEYQLGPLNFAANSETKYLLGDFKQEGLIDGINYKKVEGLGQILNPVPSRIEVKDFTISFDETKWITAEAGKNYGGSFQAGVKAPIAFTEATSLSLGYEMNDLDVDLSVAGDYLKGDTRAVIKLQAINEIPFKFGLSISAQDADKKPIDGVSITPDVIEIGAGTIANPVTSAPEITIVLPSGSKLIKGISIKFNATVDSEHAGKPLNKNQSLTLKNVKLSLPDGITMDLKDVVKK